MEKIAFGVRGDFVSIGRLLDIKLSKAADNKRAVASVSSFLDWCV